MRRALFSLIAAAIVLSTPLSLQSQQVIQFDQDPFAGSNALATPGRQVVGGELFTSFDVLTDAFAFNRNVFGMGDVIKFASGVIGDVPTTDLNAIVLRTFDNDANAATPFGAGNAANLLAEQITTPGAGVFIYFNSGLDLARLVYSTDLSDNTADLKILARLTNVSGESGRDAMSAFSEDNFRIVPEPSMPVLLVAGMVLLIGRRAIRGAQYK